MVILLSGCVILDTSNNIYLLHRNRNGITQWELPGGKVETNETPEQAAVREVEEELGVVVGLNKRLGDTNFIDKDAAYKYTWFLAEVRSGELSIREPELFDDLRAFALNELAGIKLSGNMKKLQEAVLNGSVTIG